MNGQSAIANEDCHDRVAQLTDISFSYQGRKVIQNLDFSVFERDFIAITGSNGAGKTTLLRLLVGLLKPDRGEIRLFGQNISQFKEWERIGFVPQKNSFNPLFPATVKEVVLSGLYGRKKLLRRITREDERKCEEALCTLGIEQLADWRIGQLSGGQQQRVFLARALIHNPDMLILDEPTTGIDRETLDSFFHFVQHMHMKHKMTFIIVTHNMNALHSYLGEKPAYCSGNLHFYVRHSHDSNDCAETELTHPLRERQYDAVLSAE